MKRSLSPGELLSSIRPYLEKILAAKNADELTAFVAEALQDFFPVESTGFYLKNFKSGKLDLVLAIGLSSVERSEAEATAHLRHPGWVVENKKHLIANTVEDDPFRELNQRMRSTIVSRIYVPIVHANESLGALGLASYSSHAFTDQHLKILEFFAQIAGAGIVNIRSAESLYKTQQRLELAVCGSNDGIWDWDLDTNEVFYSPRWKEILGYRDDEIENVYESFQNLAHPDDLPVVEEAILQHMADPSSNFSMEIRMREKSGDYRWILSRGKAVWEDGRPKRMAGSHVDLDAQKKVEAALLASNQSALAATRAKSLFLANMSHEMRTPLNGILGMVQLLEESTLDESQIDYVESMRTCAAALAAQVNDVLDLSRIESGKITMDLKEFRMDELVEAVVHLTTQQHQSRAIQFRVERHYDGPVHAISDPDKVRQVLLNLLTNAFKFTQEGFVTLRIFLSASNYRFEVQDTGIGISKEEQANLFENFYQVDSSNARSFGGTGLGLSISRKIVELLNGKIGVQSALEQGSLFFFEIPAIMNSGIVSRHSIENSSGETKS